MRETDKYYKKEVYECKECGKQYQTPGTAELCWKKDKLMEVLEEVENHKALYLQDVIEDIERMVEEGKYDYDND
jgi:hypothetical protein